MSQSWWPFCGLTSGVEGLSLGQSVQHPPGHDVSDDACVGFSVAVVMGVLVVY